MTLLADATALRSLHARARGWARVLKLPFRQQRWHGHAGEFMGKGTGSSLDFHDHRLYLPGDDPRQINWQAYARTGTYTMKLYREEVRPLVDVIFDVSASMFAFPAKEQRALELLAFVVEASLQSGATLRCHAIAGAKHQLLEPELILSGQWHERVNDLHSTPAAPELNRLPLRAGAMRILVSDLLFPGEPETLLGCLKMRSGRGIVFAPFANEEADPGWDGNYEFIDPETGLPHEHRVEAALLKRYESAYQRHFELWKATALKHGIAMARVSSEAEFQKALQNEGVASGAVEIA
jgi:uncharacterized protein (DUF58 family)